MRIVDSQKLMSAEAMKEDIMAFLGVPTEFFDAKDAAGAPLNRTKMVWAARNPQTQEEIEEFYRTNVVYFQDLWNWVYVIGGGSHLNNTRHLKPEGHHEDVGGGIGFFAMRSAIAYPSATIYYSDVNPTLRAFVKWRAKKIGLTNLLMAHENPARVLDSVSFFDVLEHVPTWEALVKIYVALLKPGGIIIENSPFGEDEDHPMHLKCDDFGPRMVAMGLKQTEDFGVWIKT